MKKPSATRIIFEPQAWEPRQEKEEEGVSESLKQRLYEALDQFCRFSLPYGEGESEYTARAEAVRALIDSIPDAPPPNLVWLTREEAAEYGRLKLDAPEPLPSEVEELVRVILGAWHGGSYPVRGIDLNERDFGPWFKVARLVLADRAALEEKLRGHAAEHDKLREQILESVEAGKLAVAQARRETVEVIALHFEKSFKDSSYGRDVAGDIRTCFGSEGEK